MRTIESIIKVAKYQNKDCQKNIDTALIIKAWEFATVAHQNQKRLSGESYINHPMETAYILAKMGMGTETIVAGLLHDVPEETEFSIESIKKEFGVNIAFLVAGVTKIGQIKYRGVERYAENLRKMFIAMSKDIRVIIIRFADRIHNLRTLQHHPTEEKRHRIAQESLDIYAPIAARLGMYQIKEEIEDLSFKYIFPNEYKWTKEQLKLHLQRKTISLQKTKELLIDSLKENNINFTSVYGRRKRLYSLYQKLIRKNKDIEKIYDLIALRIITPDINSCYTALGLIHNNWQPLNGRVKDYISQPKPNGYKSLHTTIFDQEENPIEIQIRTKKMEIESEFGVAAHWRYKENSEIDLKNQKLKWINELVKWQEKIKDPKDYLRSIKINVDIFKSKIFVFTPKNDVIELPEQSTPIDFAYHIHTDIGNQCIGAKINNKMSKVDTELKNGDIIEIIIDKNRKSPNPDWLNFVTTNTTKQKIKNSLTKLDQNKGKKFFKYFSKKK